MTINETQAFKDKINTYPSKVIKQMKALRGLVLDTASEAGTIDSIELTLKWGEPSFLVKKGSTLRMDWKEKTPDQYALYFKCTSKLVPTFKEIFKDQFTYEKNRAIIFGLNEKMPKVKVKECIRMALTYHTIKDLPLLGHEPVK